MGHDICAFKAEDTEHENEIAYLRRSAFNSLNGTIYEALNCQEENCGCSGCGGEKKFTKTQIAEALEKVPSGEDYEPEREFLSDCLKKGDGEVVIGFW